MLFIPLQHNEWQSPACSVASSADVTPCTRTKYIFRFAGLLQLTTHALTHSHNAPNAIPIFRRLRCYKQPDEVRIPVSHFENSWFWTVTTCHGLAWRKNWRITPCRLSMTSYSIHSQLPSIPEGRPPHPEPWEATCPGNVSPQYTAANWQQQG